MDMVRILIVSPVKDSLSDLAGRFAEEKNIEVLWAESGQNALGMISHDPVDFVITDEKLGDMTGLAFAEKLVMLNPMINCAAISALSPEAFHEASEGLGLLAEVPVKPDRAAAEDLMAKLRKITNLL